MIIQQQTVCDVIATNAYFYVDEKTKHGFLIDPGAEADLLLKEIDDKGYIIEKILLTHGHFDHIGAVEKIAQTLNIPYFIHHEGKKYLTDATYNLSAWFVKPIILEKAQYFDDGDVICLSSAPDICLRVIYTPGHTSDSVIFYDKVNKIAFCGDTVFREGVGRTDVPGGDMQSLWQSIENRIWSLPDDTILYCGHGLQTSVENEKYRR